MIENLKRNERVQNLRVQSWESLFRDPPEQKNAHTAMPAITTYTGGRLPSYTGFMRDWGHEGVTKRGGDRQQTNLTI